MKKFLAVLALLSAPAFAAEEKALNFYNWTEYMPEAVLKQFTKETGIKVRQTTYASIEEMYAKLKAGGGGYDVVVPSAYYIKRMRAEDMLEPLDLTKIPNLKNFDSKYVDQAFDPGNKYTVPYLMYSVGIMVNGAKTDPSKITKWSDLWKPEYKNQLLMMDTARENFQVMMKVLGYKAGETDPKRIEEAYGKLRDLLPNVKLFNGDAPRTSFLAGEVAVGIAWSGEAYMGQQENPKITYIYPQEGIIFGMDTLAIPKGAKHPENAHKFIDFVSRPDIAAKISQEIGYGTPNAEAVKKLPAKFAQNRIVFPTADDLKNADYMEDVPSDTQSLYEKYWSELKTGKKVVEKKG